jgi:hypothetical protein
MNYSVSISNNFPQFMRTDPRDMPDFDGVKIEEKIFCDTPTEFKITLGARMAQGEWPQRETLTFDAFATKLSQSPAGPKDGTCYTPATFRGINRKKNDADEIGIVALDADCGHSFEEIIDAVEKAGLAAIVHATHSHLTTESEISCRDYDKWADAHPGRDVAAYMREKRSYLPRVVAGAKITGKTAAEKNYIVEHQPCPKFRVIVPLAGHWRAKDFENQLAANAAWRQFITALASWLGLQHDQACTDTSRLFFFPRARQGGPEYEFRQVTGNACSMQQVLSQAPESLRAASAATAERRQAHHQVPIRELSFEPGRRRHVRRQRITIEGSRPPRTQIWVCRVLLSQCLRGTRSVRFASGNAG